MNPENLWKTTPLQIALLKKHFLCVKLLLQNSNINVNTIDDQGRSLIGFAIESLTESNCELTLKMITDYNADPNL